MEQKEKIEHFKFVINRYDHYFESINSKGNVYLALNTFLLGGMAAGFYSLVIKGSIEPCLLILMAFAIVTNLISIGISLWAVKPFLSTNKDNQKGSLIYFGDISCYPFGVYQKLVQEYDRNKLFEDMEKQVHILAQGLKTKFTRMSFATYFLGIQFLFLAIIAIIIINK